MSFARIYTFLEIFTIICQINKIRLGVDIYNMDEFIALYRGNNIFALHILAQHD